MRDALRVRLSPDARARRCLVTPTRVASAQPASAPPPRAATPPPAAAAARKCCLGALGAACCHSNNFGAARGHPARCGTPRARPAAPARLRRSAAAPACATPQSLAAHAGCRGVLRVPLHRHGVQVHKEVVRRADAATWSRCACCWAAPGDPSSLVVACCCPACPWSAQHVALALL